MTLTREQARERTARLRQKWLDENGPCRRCGSWEALEVDHVDPRTKLFRVSFSEGKAARERELVKCQPLCHPCHLDKTASEREVVTHCPKGHEYTPENTRNRAGIKSCRRCQRDLNREWMRQYRSRG